MAMDIVQRLRCVLKGNKDAQAAADEILKLRGALERIERWHGEFPATGRYWDEPKNADPMSYSACFGSNGERDYMRQVARDALPPNVLGKGRPACGTSQRPMAAP